MSEFLIKVDNEIVIIKKVPAFVCEDCGEKFITPAISKKIDKIMKSYFEGSSSLPYSLTPVRELDLPA